MKESCKNIEKEREKYSVHMKRKKEDFYRDFYFVLFRENIMSKDIRRWKDCIIIFTKFQMFLFRANL